MNNITEILRLSKKRLITDIILPKNPTIGDGFYYFPSDNYNICLVAHIDTVFDDDDEKLENGYKRIYINKKRNILWSPDGLGGDDRAGVWGSLYLKEKIGCSVLLTDFEESGGGGAREALDTIGEEISKFSMFVELDRFGGKQMVFYNNENEIFKKFIEIFGFTHRIGIFSDIYIISRMTGIPCVNLSIGFESNHSKDEILNLNNVCYSINKTMLIIKTLNNGIPKDITRRKEAVMVKNFESDMDYYTKENINFFKKGVIANAYTT